MDPITLTPLVIGVVQVTGTCLKSISKIVGPSQHSSEGLKDILLELYSFNAAILNLKAHLDLHKEDQDRLHALLELEKPLKRSDEALNLIHNRLQSVTFVRKLQNQVFGSRFDEKLKGSMRSLKVSRALFSEVLLIDQRAIGSAVQKCLRDLAEHVVEVKAWQVKAEQEKNDDKDLKILDWLSSRNFLTKKNDVLSRRHEQTGAWFLNSTTFKEWLAGPARTLWCPGIPGSGKTVLAALAVDYLRTVFKDENTAVVCVFCSYADLGNQKSDDLVASVLEQLVRSKGVTNALRMLYQQHQRQRTHLGPKELAKLLNTVMGCFGKVFIVIDALDECPETTRNSVLVEIYKLENLPHLLITSRHSISIANICHDAVHLEIQASDTDLEIYVRSKIQQDRDLAGYVDQDSFLQEDIVKTTVGNAKGMFLLVQLHMESLARQLNKRDVRNALKSLPKELNATYDHAMERIRSQDAGSARLAERVLAWIFNVRRPFSVKELQHALAIRPGDKKFDNEGIYSEDRLVSICAGLVAVDRHSQIIRLVHYTTQGYFERLRSEMSSRDRLEIQIEITKTCITYLELDDFECDEYTHGEEHIDVSPELCWEYPFLDYAGKLWGHHARGWAEHHAGDMIYHLLLSYSRLRLACDLIGDSRIRHFGPIPELAVLVYFGLEHLVSHFKNMDESFVNEVTCLRCAIRYRDGTLVFFLVERDTDWFDSGKYVTMLSSFELDKNETMVRLLADLGAVVDLSVDNGDFLFTRSLVKYPGADRREPISTLLELGATFDHQNITYYTPLMCAVLGGDLWGVLKLLKGGVVVNEKNEHGRDALIYAALARYEKVVRPLLEAGVDVHSRDEYGMTALCAACEGGNLKIVKVLVERGANISAQDKSGRTPISIATEDGHARVIELLRGQGVDPYLQSQLVPGMDAPHNLYWHRIKPDGSVSMPQYKPVVPAQPGAPTRGYDEAVPAWVQTYFEGKKAHENDSASDEEQESEPSKSDDSTKDEGQETEPSKSDDSA